MRQAYALCGLSLLIFAAGCSTPEPPAVFVDISRLEREFQPGAPAIPALVSDNISQSTSMPGSPGGRIFSALSDAEFDASLRQVRSNQAAAVKKILEQRLRVLDAEIESAIASSRARLEPDHERLLQDAIAQTRIPFDRMAPEVGRLTLEMANLIGFPDRGQDIRVVDADWSRKRAARLAEIRAELVRLNDEYLRERNAILSAAYQRIERDYDALDTNAAVARREGETRLIAALKKLSSDSGATLTRPRLQGEQWQTPPSAGRSSSIGGSSVTLPGSPATPETREPKWIAGQKAKIWSAIKGYRLVSTKAEGRDATNECLEWIRTQKVGP